jgi:hypothetical protein
MPMHLTRILLSLPVRAIVLLIIQTPAGTSISQLPDVHGEGLANAAAILV